LTRLIGWLYCSPDGLHFGEYSQRRATVAQADDLRANGRKLTDVNTWTKLRIEAPLEPDLPIIDSHHHVWNDQRGRYLMDDLLEDIYTGHNIVASVFVEAGKNMYRADGPDEMKAVGEVEFVNGVAAMCASDGYGKARLCAGIIGHANLMLGDKVKPVLEALAAAGNGRFCGIRHGVTSDPGPAARHSLPLHMMLDPAFRRGLAHLQPMGLTFDAWLFYTQLTDLMDLLRAFPDTTMVMNHVGGILGVPPHDGKREEIFAIWRGHMQKLAKFPNLNVKVGGLGMLRCGWDFHIKDMPPSSEEVAAAWRPYVETCIELFGPERCLMESNFPPDKQTCSYSVLWNAMKRITKNCSAAAKAAMYHDTAARIYRIKI